MRPRRSFSRKSSVVIKNPLIVKKSITPALPSVASGVPAYWWPTA